MVKDLEKLYILGIMSGTSLDGLDLAYCSFSRTDSKWDFDILKACTIAYPPGIKNSLENSIHLSSEELFILDHKYGKWVGQEALGFLESNKLKADWIASHGHTVFHQPAKGFTLQIGNGHDIAALANHSVIYDFRSLDVALGGQGAPLVPCGDHYLFGSYDFCLNLGGFSNVSFEKENRRIAFDICPVNMGLNHLALKTGLDYDISGNLGRSGDILPTLLDQMNRLGFYAENPPKSLGREWFNLQMLPLLEKDYELKDISRTLYEHISLQIGSVLNNQEGKTVLVTGGGAKNSFLTELIAQKTNRKISIPDDILIDFKEAMIFAFLGYLRINNIHNVFRSVTGCSDDHCAGAVIKRINL